MPEFMSSFWSLCPSMACGFKVFPGQIRPLSSLRQIFDGVPAEARPTLRAIILERSNITAEWLSVRKAASTGNWGTSPQRQQTIASSTRLSERLKAAARADAAARSVAAGGVAAAAHGAPTGATSASAGGAAEAKGAAAERGPSLEQFTREHKAWFSQVGKVCHKRAPGKEADGAAVEGAPVPPTPIPTLHVYTESLVDGGEHFERTMRSVYEFLRLPPLEGPIALPARVTAPEKKQVGKRVTKSKSYKQRREAELKRRNSMLRAAPTSTSSAPGA